MLLNRDLVAEARSTRGFFIPAVLLGLLNGLATIIQAAILSRLVTAAFLEGKSLEECARWLIGLLVVSLLRSAAVFGGEVLAGRGSVVVREKLRLRLLRHLFALGPAYMQDERNGAQAAAAIQGIDALDAYFSQYLPQVALAGLIPLAVLAVSFPIDWLTGLIFLLTAPLIPIFMVLIGQASERLTRQQFGALSRMSAFLLDTIQGLTTLKLLDQCAAQGERIAVVSDEFRHKTLRVLRVAFLSALVLEMIGTLSTAVIAVQIGLRLLSGGMQFEPAFFVLILAPEFYLPLRLLGQRFHAGETGRAAAKKIFEVLATPLPKDGRQTVDGSDGLTIQYDQVSFSYPGRTEPVLTDVCFTLQPNQVTALVGSSGTGKSTIANLLLRFAHPSTGSIKVNGANLAALKASTWREQLAWLPQNPHQFYGTIRENLQLANQSASDEAVRSACRLARLEEFIDSLPAGFETLVGEGGMALSGGQMQRLALARAFLRGGRLLVVDEPTAWLDAQLERELSDELAALSREKTVLLIAHRMQTVMRADWVVVIEDGRVVEQGKPAELAERGGRFSRMARQGGVLS
jgi:ATP-binding cassette subfamily C protein CydD